LIRLQNAARDGVDDPFDAEVAAQVLATGPTGVFAHLVKGPDQGPEVLRPIQKHQAQAVRRAVVVFGAAGFDGQGEDVSGEMIVPGQAQGLGQKAIYDPAMKKRKPDPIRQPQYDLNQVEHDVASSTLMRAIHVTRSKYDRSPLVTKLQLGNPTARKLLLHSSFTPPSRITNQAVGSWSFR
jgi:hypothetical protein